MPSCPKPSKKKKPSRKKLIRDLDQVIRLILRKRDTICCSCGKNLEEGAQVSHYVTRKVYALRWDLRNVAMSCPGCNLRHNYDPIPYTMWMVRTHGNGILKELQETKNKVKKLSTNDLQTLLDELSFVKESFK